MVRQKDKYLPRIFPYDPFRHELWSISIFLSKRRSVNFQPRPIPRTSPYESDIIIKQNQNKISSKVNPVNNRFLHFRFFLWLYSCPVRPAISCIVWGITSSPLSSLIITPKRFLASPSHCNHRRRSRANFNKNSLLWHRWVMCHTYPER